MDRSRVSLVLNLMRLGVCVLFAIPLVFAYRLFRDFSGAESINWILLLMMMFFFALCVAIFRAVYGFTGFVFLAEKHGLADLQAEEFIRRAQALHASGEITDREMSAIRKRVSETDTLPPDAT